MKYLPPNTQQNENKLRPLIREEVTIQKKLDSELKHVKRNADFTADISDLPKVYRMEKCSICCLCIDPLFNTAFTSNFGFGNKKLEEGKMLVNKPRVKK